MKNVTKKSKKIKGIKNKKIEIDFNGQYVTSDAGLLTLRTVEEKTKFLKRISKCIKDTRHPGYIEHSIETMLKQRVFGIAAGYEDVTDHNSLRIDKMLKLSLNKDGEDDPDLASGSTLCRFENMITREDNVRMSKELVEEFIRSKNKQVPKELILDFDATDSRIHGDQEGKYFHGYYDKYCFLPLYVFCGEELLVAYLRRSNKGAAHRCKIILKLLVDRFRKEWPDIRIVFRGDSGFCSHKMMDWCDKNNVYYITGISKNNRLLTLSENIIEESEKQFEDTKIKVRHFGEIKYAAKTWSRERRVIVKAEQLSKGENIRFVVTNIEKHHPQTIYDKIYTARGDMENRIKEQQLYLFADMVSCHYFIANQFRMLLSSFAYVILQKIRSIALEGTKYAKLQCCTIRNKFIKIGATIRNNTRRIIISFSGSYPYKNIFWKIIEIFQE
jgi:hypothetical protein